MKLRGDGDPHKRWSMWFNSSSRNLRVTSATTLEIELSFETKVTGGALLSSARVS